MFDKKAYMKEWNRQYYINNKKRENERSKQQYRNNPNYHEKYYEGNKEKILKQHKQWSEDNPEYNKKYYIGNVEKMKKQRKQYMATEKGKANRQRGSVKRQAREKNIINTLTAEEWIDILKEYKFKCAYCGCEFTLFNRETRDHVIPISKGGNNVKENIVPSCKSCNSKKHNKIIIGGEF